MQGNFSQFGAFLLAALLVFAVYRRLRRSFGQQPLQPVRMLMRIALLLIVGCLLLPAALRSAPSLYAMLAGVIAGIGLALWGAARTRFVRAADRLYYVPHTYTGVAVALLFVGRLAYRLVQAYGSDQHSTPTAMLSSPLTAGLFFVLMGYYVCYYGVVLWKSKRSGAVEIDTAAAPPPDDTSRV